METKQELLKETGHKNIMVLNATAMQSDYDGYTNALVSKMYEYVKKQDIDVTIRMDSASKVDKVESDIDIILLAPELFGMADEIKEKYPNKVVKVIDQKDYGFLNGENILKDALG